MENGLHQCTQTIKAESHVDGMERYEDPGGRRDAQHRPLRINRIRP